MGPQEGHNLKMNSQDLAGKLLIVANMLEDLLKEDLGTVRVTEEWSNIDDAARHIQFLLEQTAGVAQNLQERHQVDSSQQENLNEQCDKPE